jgi:hypothetical protein
VALKSKPTQAGECGVGMLVEVVGVAGWPRFGNRPKKRASY